jgi:hypothetical protein
LGTGLGGICGGGVFETALEVTLGDFLGDCFGETLGDCLGEPLGELLIFSDDGTGAATAAGTAGITAFT